MHMVSKKDLDSAEFDHEDIEKSDEVTANGEVQTREEATVSVKQMDLIGESYAS